VETANVGIRLELSSVETVRLIPRGPVRRTMQGWTIGLIILGVLTVVLGFFMLTVQVCVWAIVSPLGTAECVQWAPAFLFSGSLTIFMGIMMVMSGGYQAYAEM
jgi:hypothetical protein